MLSSRVMWHRVHSDVKTWLLDSLLQHNALFVIFFKTIIRFGYVIFGIIEISESVISLRLRLRLRTLLSTSIIPDIIKTSSNNCLLTALK